MGEADESLATAQEYKDFMGSDVWKDMELVLSGRLEEAQDKLENEKEHSDLLRLQGSVKEIRALLDLPNTVIAELEFEASQLGGKETDKNDD